MYYFWSRIINYFRVHYYKDIKKEANTSEKMYFIILDDKGKIEQMCLIWEEVILSMLPHLRSCSNYVRNSFRTKEEKNGNSGIQRKNQMLIQYKKILEIILKRKEISLEKWNSDMEEYKNCQEISERVKRFENYLEKAVLGEKIHINYEIPQMLNYEHFLFLHKAVLCYRLYLLQFKIKEKYIQNQNITQDQLYEIEEEVIKKSIDIRNKLLNNLNIYKRNDEEYKNLILQARENFLSDREFENDYKSLKNVYNVVKLSIKNGEIFHDLRKDPLSFSDYEIFLTWSNLHNVIEKSSDVFVNPSYLISYNRTLSTMSKSGEQ